MNLKQAIKEYKQLITLYSKLLQVKNSIDKQLDSVGEQCRVKRQELWNKLTEADLVQSGNFGFETRYLKLLLDIVD